MQCIMEQNIIEIMKWPYFCIFFQIWQKYPAPAEFLPEPDFCRIRKKHLIPAGAGIRYSPSFFALLSCLEMQY